MENVKGKIVKKGRKYELHIKDKDGSWVRFKAGLNKEQAVLLVKFLSN